jgi:hypothetical protein
MCCLVTAVLVLGPRLTILAWWLMDTARFALAFQSPAWPFRLPFPYWVWPLLGLIFLPWMTLAYLLVFPGGVVGLDWLWLGLGLLIDVGSYSSGGYSRRHRD